MLKLLCVCWCARVQSITLSASALSEVVTQCGHLVLGNGFATTVVDACVPVLKVGQHLCDSSLLLAWICIGVLHWWFFLLHIPVVTEPILVEHGPDCSCFSGS